jgi:nucleoside-diphosphate-sugar epimerase
MVVRVFVAGGSRALERRLVPQLVARGHQVTATATGPASEWLPYLAACAGAKRPVRVPKWVARLLAGEMVVIMMTEGRGFCNAKAKRELGWKLRYPSWRQGFKEELA